MTAIQSAAPTSAATAPVLSVDDLTVTFEGAPAPTIDGVSLSIAPGEVVAVVGESGCGKSLTSYAVMGLLPANAHVTRGSISLDDRGDLTRLSGRQLRSVQGAEIAMVFQEPMTSLNPMMRIGAQIAESIRMHQDLRRGEVRDAVIAMLEDVGIREAARVYRRYPHELSGGMRQRVMIAMAMSCHPRLLIADEPTTALDVSIQAQILQLMRRLQQRNGMGILLITHDLGVVAEMADRVVVMYAGQVVEDTDVFTLFREPRHPYTRALMKSTPRIDETRTSLEIIPGQVPSQAEMPHGCRFAPRCERAQAVCEESAPPLLENAGSTVRCWLHDPEVAP